MPKVDMKIPSLTQEKAKIKAASTAKAKEAFKNFSLSKFPTGTKPPANHVAKGQNVADMQRVFITEKLRTLKSTGPGMTITVSDSKTLNLETGKVNLSELISLIEEKMHGTEFYATGNTMINRINVQDQVNKIISDIKGGTKNE